MARVRKYKSVRTLAQKMKNGQITLKTVATGRAYLDGIGWTDIDTKLESDDLYSIAEALSSSRRTVTKIVDALGRLESIPVKWYFDRIIFDPKRNAWSYCAGQDYVSETMSIKKHLSKKW